MIRKVFKKNKRSTKIDKFLRNYNIPREHLSVNRKSITRAIFVGLFIGLIPMPFQMLVVVFAGIFVIFNVPLAISLVWLSNPITMPFMYYIEYKTGSFLLGYSTLNVELSVEWFQNHLSEIFLPLYVGTLFYSVTLSFLAYYSVNWLWIYSVNKQKQAKKHKK